MAAIRIVLADDHPVVRDGVRLLLERDPDLIVVGEAGDGTEALRLVAELEPDVLVLDMEMPGFSGVEVARRLQESGSSVRVLGLSAYDDEEYIAGLLGIGAAGYLTKDEARQRIVEAVRGVARGETGWLSRRATAKVLGRRQAAPDSLDKASSLTAREREVLRLMALGQDNAQIATALSISVGTVRTHVGTIFNKLALHRRSEAVAWAWAQGLAEKYGSAVASHDPSHPTT